MVNDITKETAKASNDLLEYLYDSYNGYKECASQVSDPIMQELFNSLALRRQEMINELSAQIRVLNEEPIKSGSITAAAHRAFIDVKSLVTGGDKEAIVNEVKRGENYTIDRYREILSKNLPIAIKQVLLRQLSEIEANVAKVEQMH